MKKNNLLNFKHIFFVGIGGISQSDLAKICLSEGIKVSGSDKEKTHITEELQRIGVNIFYCHSYKNLKNVDLVVYSGAIKKDNEELVMAEKSGIRVMERSEFLGQISSMYKNVIAVSGVHGKTTTTGMLATIFIEAGLNPTIHIGGELKNIQSNVKIGSKDYFITEACEYRESFLYLNPNTSIILNIEEDHMDYYNSINHIISAFNKFCLKSDSVIIGESFKSLVDKKDLITFSIGGNSVYTAKNIVKSYDGTSFSVYKKAKFWGKVKLKMYGEHNVYNSLASIAVSEKYGIDKNVIITALEKYCGVKRRFDVWCEKPIVIHDYAHHPTEIKSVIKTCKEYFGKPVICFFQPHTYSRTKALWSEFLNAFNLADNIYILPTYPARESPSQGYSAHFLFKNLKIKYSNVFYLKKFSSVQKIIKKGGDGIFLILGAGDIYKTKNLL